MPPQLASLLTIGFMVFLFRRDIREKPNITNALWIPVLWMFLVASRPPSQWLYICGLPGFGATSDEEGSSLDAMVFVVLIVLGLRVLSRRKISFAQFAKYNPWLLLFLIYCVLAITWSDFAFVSFKRFIKVLGHPIMVLIVFSEPDPPEALLRLMKRCSYVILPVSILWMKYYLALGRKVSEFGGVTNCGIAAGKNLLAAIVSGLGIFFFWRFLQVWRMPKGKEKRDEFLLTSGLLLLVGYCVVKASSATSDICFLIGAGTIVLLGFRAVDKRAMGIYATAAIIAFVLAQVFFDVYGLVTDLTGHEATLESRGLLWQTLLTTDHNPIFGTGFECYWLGDRLTNIWSMPEFWWQPNQAHNGYLEMYLNLGIVGVLIFASVVVATFFKIKQDLITNLDWGRYRLACLLYILLHNWTEAGFKGLSFPFFMFFIIAVDVPGAMLRKPADSAEVLEVETEPEYAYSAKTAA